MVPMANDWDEIICAFVDRAGSELRIGRMMTTKADDSRRQNVRYRT
jgi:hypothetical protein